MVRSTTPQPALSSPDSSTLYPKITNHVSEVIKTLKDLHHDPKNPSQEITFSPLPITGTVKLHGTHADILIRPSNEIVFQSRNIVGLQTSKDNAGFATHMSSKTKPLLRLRDILLARYATLHSDMPLNPDLPVLIAGEWIGSNIQKDVAIAQLSKRFIIISVHINGSWQRDSDFSGIALPQHDIYNVSRAGVFSMMLYPDDPQRTNDELAPLAEKVAAQCPFAETFGVQGEGEGIVWKITDERYNVNPALWFKTKGGRFKPTFARPPKRQSSDAGERNREVAAEVAGVWCDEHRLRQGVEYLKELGATVDMKGLTRYLKWIQNDILVEERAYIAEHKIDVASLRIEIAKIAKPWYVCNLGER